MRHNESTTGWVKIYFEIILSSPSGKLWYTLSDPIFLFADSGGHPLHLAEIPSLMTFLHLFLRLM